LREVTSKMLQFCREFQACSDLGTMATLKNEVGQTIALMVSEFPWLRDVMKSGGPNGPSIFEDEPDRPQKVSEFGHVIYHNFKPLMALRRYLLKVLAGSSLVHFDGFSDNKWTWDKGIREDRISPPSRYMYECGDQPPDMRGSKTVDKKSVFTVKLVSTLFIALFFYLFSY
jgi:hypothetical protein